MSGGMIIIDTSGLADIVMTTNGDMIYYNAGRQRLAKGSDGQQLQIAGGFPSWVTSAGGSVSTNEAVNDYSTTLADYNEAITTATASNYTSQAYTYAQTSTGTDKDLDGNYMSRFTVIESGFAGIGATITEIKVRMKKQGSPSGTLTVGIDNTSTGNCGTTMVTSFGTMNPSSLTTSMANYTFNSGSHVLAVNDLISVADTSGWGSGSNRVWRDSGGSVASDTASGYKYGTCRTTDTSPNYWLEISGTSYNTADKAIDGNTTSYWESNAGVNNWLQTDLGSSQTVTAMTIYLDTTATTETQFLLQSSSDALSWNDLRTINVSDLSDAVYNYIRFDAVEGRYFRIYGNSGSSSVMKINEVAIQPLTVGTHGHLGIDPADTTLALNGT